MQLHKVFLISGRQETKKEERRTSVGETRNEDAPDGTELIY